MRLSGKLYEQIGEALIDAFEYDSFAAMLLAKLDFRLDLVVSNVGFESVVWTTLNRMERADRVAELVRGAKAWVPTNKKLQALPDSFRDVAGDKAEDEPPASGIFAQVWQHYRREVVDADMMARWRRYGFDAAETRYRERVKRNHATTHFLGKAAPVPMGQIYTDVYLLKTPAALQRYTEQEMESLFGQRRRRFADSSHQRIDGVEVVANKDKLFILGKPGAGKTTFLKHLALQYAADATARLPIFITLKRLVQLRKTIFDQVKTELNTCRFPDSDSFVTQLLESGNCLLLLDGLDEVATSSEQLEAVLDDIEQFVEEFGASQVIITSRTATTPARLQGFSYVEMADFTDEQIDRFVGAWFGVDDEQGAAFLHSIRDRKNEDLYDLARVPLLLSLLCVAFEVPGGFAEQRYQVYADAVNALLVQWDAMGRKQRDESILTLAQKQALLARLAFTTFERGEYFIRQAVLESEIAAFLEQHVPDSVQRVRTDIIVDLIESQHGLLVERARQLYSFAHLTFQEYFTARFIVDNVGKGTLQQLMLEATDSRWREVFLLTASMLGDADQFFALFGQQLDSMIANQTEVIDLLAWVDTERGAHESLAAYKPPAPAPAPATSPSPAPSTSTLGL